MEIKHTDISVQVLPVMEERVLAVDISFTLNAVSVFETRRNRRELEARLRDEVFKIIKEV